MRISDWSSDVCSSDLAAARKLVVAGKLFPVFCGTAFKNKGVQPLLDAVVAYLPSPVELPPVDGKDPANEDKILHRKPERSEERRVGEECVSTCRFRWSQYP